MSIIYLTASYNEKNHSKEGTIVNIRYATMADLDDIASVESECFPVLEAATKEEFEQRIKYFGNHFWLMFDEGKLIAFVDGFVTDEYCCFYALSWRFKTWFDDKCRD